MSDINPEESIGNIRGTQPDQTGMVVLSAFVKAEHAERIGRVLARIDSLVEGVSVEGVPIVVATPNVAGNPTAEAKLPPEPIG